MIISHWKSSQVKPWADLYFVRRLCRTTAFSNNMGKSIRDYSRLVAFHILREEYGVAQAYLNEVKGGNDDDDENNKT